MLYTEKPENFSPKFEGVGCFLECNGKVLLLFRSSSGKFQPSMWCTPGGKCEQGETKEESMLRELCEETGISFSDLVLQFTHTTYVQYPEVDFIWHVFKIPLLHEPVITLNGEHTEYAWFTPQEALAVNLIPDEDAVIRLVYGEHL